MKRTKADEIAMNISEENTAIETEPYPTGHVDGPETPAEEWIWVEGFKGTHKDLTAHGNFQFEMNKVYDMPEDVTTARADAMSAQLDAYTALMNAGAQCADGLRAGVMSIDEWPKENPSIGIKRRVKMPEKYLSIITNFGCHFTCPYCIVKNNHIDVPRTTIESLDKLKDAVKAEGATIISVSGGGDPLHNYSEHKDYYDKLFALCEEMNIPLEMHTSYLNMKDFPYEKCHRVVYHCRGINQLKDIERKGREKIRIVFVVNEDFNRRLLLTIHELYQRNRHIDELSFRQMVGDNYEVTNYYQDFLRIGHKEGWWHYIEQGDYNTYFVEGKLYYNFSDIKGEKEND